MTLGAFDASGRRRPELSKGDRIRRCRATRSSPPSGSAWKVSESSKGLPLVLTQVKPWRSTGHGPDLGAVDLFRRRCSDRRCLGGRGHRRRRTRGNRDRRTLYRASHAFWRTDKEVQTSFDPDADPAPFAREKPPVIAVDRRGNNFDEVEECWTEGVALVRQSAACVAIMEKPSVLKGVYNADLYDRFDFRDRSGRRDGP